MVFKARALAWAFLLPAAADAAWRPEPDGSYPVG